MLFPFRSRVSPSLGCCWFLTVRKFPEPRLFSPHHVKEGTTGRFANRRRLIIILLIPCIYFLCLTSHLPDQTQRSCILHAPCLDLVYSRSSTCSLTLVPHTRPSRFRQPSIRHKFPLSMILAAALHPSFLHTICLPSFPRQGRLTIPCEVIRSASL